jgi:hypothetical protein
MLEIQELKTLLTQYNLPIKEWSHELGKKTINDLNNELNKGESSLELKNNQLYRITKVSSIEVKVKIGTKIFTVVEDKQIFLTGMIRKRGLRNISEKIREQETPESAAWRGLQEELGLTTDKQLIFLGETTTESQSPSYPGLSCRYQVFNYQITLDEQELKNMKFFEYRNNKVTFFTLESEI